MTDYLGLAGVRALEMRRQIEMWLRRASLPVVVKDVSTVGISSNVDRRYVAVIVDCTVLSRAWAHPGRLLDYDCPVALCLLRSDNVPATWLPVVAHTHVRVLLVDCALSVTPIISWLERDVLGPSTSDLTATLLTLDRSLQEVEPLVATVVARPWQVRRPLDLAYWSGASRAQLRLACLAAGFARVEHFILYVRWLAYSCLRRTSGVASWRVRLAVGVGDESNFRRQVGRIRRDDKRGPGASQVKVAPAVAREQPEGHMAFGDGPPTLAQGPSEPP